MSSLLFFERITFLTRWPFESSLLKELFLIEPEVIPSPLIVPELLFAMASSLKLYRNALSVPRRQEPLVFTTNESRSPLTFSYILRIGLLISSSSKVKAVGGFWILELATHYLSLVVRTESAIYPIKLVGFYFGHLYCIFLTTAIYSLGSYSWSTNWP